MAVVSPKKPSTFVVFNKHTGEAKETVFSAYAAKHRTQHHNAQARTGGHPFKWRKLSDADVSKLFFYSGGGGSSTFGPSSDDRRFLVIKGDGK